MNFPGCVLIVSLVLWFATLEFSDESPYPFGLWHRPITLPCHMSDAPNCLFPPPIKSTIPLNPPYTRTSVEALKYDSVLPSFTLLTPSPSPVSKTVKVLEPKLSPPTFLLALSCLLFISIISFTFIAVLMRYCASAVDLDTSCTTACLSGETDHPLEKYFIELMQDPIVTDLRQIVPPAIKRYDPTDNCGDLDASYSRSWKVPSGHVTLIYTPDNNVDADQNFYVEAAVGKYEYTVRRVPPETPIKPMEGIDDIIAQSSSATTKITTSTTTSDSTAVPNAHAGTTASNSLDIATLLESADPTFLLPLMSSSIEGLTDYSSISASVSRDVDFASPHLPPRTSRSSTPDIERPPPSEGASRSPDIPSILNRLSAPPTTIDSVNIQNIDEEIACYLLPFARGGNSTGFSPLMSPILPNSPPLLGTKTNVPAPHPDTPILPALSPTSASASMPSVPPRLPQSSPASPHPHFDAMASNLSDVDQEAIDKAEAFIRQCFQHARLERRKEVHTQHASAH